MKQIVATLAAVILAGCASAGTDYSQAAADAIQPGASRAEVVAALGPPNGSSTLPDGRQVLVWTHVKANGLTGASEGRSTSYLFGADGRMIRQVTKTNMPGKAGL